MKALRIAVICCGVGMGIGAINATNLQDLRSALAADKRDPKKCCELLRTVLDYAPNGQDKPSAQEAQSLFLQVLKTLPMPMRLIQNDQGKLEMLFSLNSMQDNAQLLALYAETMRPGYNIITREMSPSQGLRFLADVVQVFEERCCVGFTPTCQRAAELFATKTPAIEALRTQVVPLLEG